MYQVKFSEHAVKELKKLDKPTVRVIKNWIIKNLVDTTDPRQHSKPLQGIWKEYGGTGSGITGFLREIRKDVLIVFLFEMAHRVNIFISVGSKHRVAWRPYEECWFKAQCSKSPLWRGGGPLAVAGSFHHLSSSIWVRGCSTSNRRIHCTDKRTHDGTLDLSKAPFATSWPSFPSRGRQRLTVRQTSNIKLQTSNYKLQTTNYKLSFPALPARASSRDRAWAGESPNSPLFPSGTGCQFWGCQCQYYIYTNVDTLFDTLFLFPIRIAFFFLFIL